MEHQETSLRVAYALHSSSPGAWGWEVTSREGYGWGTAPTEAEAGTIEKTDKIVR